MRLLSSCVFLLAVVFVPALAEDLCSKCNCYPQRQPITVYCNCNPSFSRLKISAGDMKDKPTVKKFTVSFCESVEFLKNSFAEANDLQTLSLQQIGNVTIQMGVFSSLKMLVIEDVLNLKLEKKAFMGVDELRNVVIRRSSIPNIPEHALYDVKGLTSMELEDVTIGTIKSRSVQLKMADGFPITINNCSINHIEEDGLVLQPTREFHLSNSKLMNVEKNGINIFTEGNVSLVNNHIGVNISTDAVHITAGAIDINSNVIEYLPTNFISKMVGRLSFSNNTLLQSNLDISDLASLFNTSSTGNRAPCLCSQRATIYNLSLDKDMASVLEKIYCIAPCNISLLTYPDKCPNLITEEDDVAGNHLCDTETTTETTILPTLRTGKHLAPDNSGSQSNLTAAPRVSISTPIPTSDAVHISTCLSLILLTVTTSIVHLR